MHAIIVRFRSLWNRTLGTVRRYYVSYRYVCEGINLVAFAETCWNFYLMGHSVILSNYK